MVNKKSKISYIPTAINYFSLIILGFITLYPFLYFLVLSFNDGFDAMKGGIYFLPRQFTLSNYVKVFENPNIFGAVGISVMRTVLGTVISVILTAGVAFALTYKKLPGRTFLIFFFFFTTIFNGGLIPFYILMREMRLSNTFWIYILPFIYNFFNIVIMRTYFDTIPPALKESAFIDGCNDLKIFYRIYLPLSMPMLATIALFYGVGHWNDWFTGAYYVTNVKLLPAATLLQKILSEASFGSEMFTQGGGVNTSAAKASTTPEALQMTFLVITTLPIVCVYPFLQKYFTKGVLIGSIKE